MIINTASSLLKVRFKTIVFDVDGVLVDVSASFRRMITRAVRIYLEAQVQKPLHFEPMPEELIQMFKNHGGFNNDWELARAAVLFYLDFWASGSVEPLPPDRLQQYLTRASSIAPGIEGVEALIKVPRYSAAEIEQLCMSLYAGDRTREVYGVDRHPAAPKRGLYANETILIDESLLSQQFAYGLITGRTPGELGLFLERVPRLKQLIGDNIVCDDGGRTPRKPDPAVLLHLKKLETPAIFIGDTVDDINTVKRADSAALYSGAVAHSPELFRLFSRLKADIIAENVNDLLLFITKSGEQIEEGKD